jgi:hypothetical protein
MAVTMVIGNSPEIHRSLLANGSTMASVIANEFAEASGDLHLSALMEIGLALFIVTIIVNAFARLLVWAVTRGAPARRIEEQGTGRAGAREFRTFPGCRAKRRKSKLKRVGYLEPKPEGDREEKKTEDEHKLRARYGR